MNKYGEWGYGEMSGGDVINPGSMKDIISFNWSWIGGEVGGTVLGKCLDQGFPTCGPWAKSGPPSLYKWPLASQQIKIKYKWKIAKMYIL